RQIRLAAGRRKRAGDVLCFAFGVRQFQYEHVLGEPAFIACLDRCDPKRVAFLSKQCISTVSGTKGTDFARFVEGTDIFMLGVAWPRRVLLVRSEWCSDGMQAFHKIPIHT